MFAIKERLRREGLYNSPTTTIRVADNNNNAEQNRNLSKCHSFHYLTNCNYKPEYNDNSRIMDNSHESHTNQLAAAQKRQQNQQQQQQEPQQQQQQENNFKYQTTTGDLYSAPATANKSCQQQQQYDAPLAPQKQLSEPRSLSAAPAIQRYQGHHPHFHHHTTPAYYTDVDLRIHTPNAADVGALNENYQSVYRTPTNLLGQQRSFPRSSAAPKLPIFSATTKHRRAAAQSQPTATVAVATSPFFRGEAVGRGLSPQLERRQQIYNAERCARDSPTHGAVAAAAATPDVSGKGEDCTPVDNHYASYSRYNSHCNHLSQTQQSPVNHRASVVSASSNIIPLVATTSSLNPSPVVRRRLANSSRKRAVRVRSESRAISGLYDIICKEKGLEIGTPSDSSDDAKENQPTATSGWIINNTCGRMMSSDLENGLHSLGTGPDGCSNGKPRRKVVRSRDSLSSQLQRLSVNDDDSAEQSDDAQPKPNSCKYALKTSHKQSNNSSSSALPPGPQSYSAGGLRQTPAEYTRPASASSRLQWSSEMLVRPTSVDSTNSASASVHDHQQLHHFSQPKPSIISSLIEIGASPRKLDNRCHTDADFVGLEQPPIANGSTGSYNSGHSIVPPMDQWQRPSSQPTVPTSGAKRYITRSSRAANRHPSPTTSKRANCRSTPSASPSPSPARKPLTHPKLAAATLCAQPNAQNHQTQPGVMTQAPEQPSDPAATVATAAASKPAAGEDREQQQAAQEQQRRQPRPQAQPDISYHNNGSAASVVVVAPPAASDDKSVNGSHLARSRKSNNQRRKNCTSTIITTTTTTGTVTATATETPIAPTTSNFKCKINKIHNENNSNNKTNCNADKSDNDCIAVKSPLIKTRIKLANSNANGNGNSGSNISPSACIQRHHKCPLSPLRLSSLQHFNRQQPSQKQQQQQQPSPQNDSGGELQQKLKLEQEQQQQQQLQLQRNGGTHLIDGITVSAPQSPISVHYPVRTTKTTRLRAAALDKRKEEELQQQQQRQEFQRFSAPSSPAYARLRSSSSSEAHARFPSNPGRVDNHCRSPLSPQRQSSAADAHAHAPTMVLPNSPPIAGRDKSSKRKSNLNRALNEEQVILGGDLVDDSLAARRRRRRELAFGVARAMVMPDESEAPSSSKCDIKPDDAPQPLPSSPCCSNSLRTLQSADVNQKLSESTKTNLAEILKIADQANDAQQQSCGPLPVTRVIINGTTFKEQLPPTVKLSPVLQQRETTSPPSTTPSAPPAAAAQNHIVSILKKKDHHLHHGVGESSSASSNASPVTFSSTVVDVPTKQKRTGILKKRSSLDESRYYSRSHSPDERSILIKSARRNSFDESPAGSQQHGILKQSSYDSSKSDGCPSATETHPPSILKKKDSTSTPSDGSHAHKHVSISQAVILAAAELGHEADELEYHYNDNSYNTPNNEEQDLRPILKQESTSSEEYARPPKPILKKKSSGDLDELEIRPILKTSRKSSREETDYGYNGGDSSDGASGVRPILKTESPSKRRASGTVEINPPEQPSPPRGLLKRRTRSLERQGAVPVLDLAEALNAIATSQAAPTTTASASSVAAMNSNNTTQGSISVAERIKNMEKFLSNQSAAGTPATPLCTNEAVNHFAWPTPGVSDDGSATKLLLRPRALRRDENRERYKTQPVTSVECLKATSTPFDASLRFALGAKAATAASVAAMVADGGRPVEEDISPIIRHVPPAGSVGGPSASPRAALRPTSLTRNLMHGLNSSRAADQHSESYSSLGSEGSTSSNDGAGLIDESALRSLIGEATADGETLPTAQNVRARANMFQRLQQQHNGNNSSATDDLSPCSPNRPEPIITQTSRRRDAPTTCKNAAIAPPETPPKPRRSVCPTTPPAVDERASQDRQDDGEEEVEPSSLSLAERLRFFSSLSAGSAAHQQQRGRFERSNTSNGIALRVRTPSCTERSSSLGSPNTPTSSYAHTPRSSICSNRATPSPPTTSPSSTSSPTEGAMKQQSSLEYVPKPRARVLDIMDSCDVLDRASNVSTLRAQCSDDTLCEAQSATEPHSRLRAIGKLVLPDTFLNKSSPSTTPVTPQNDARPRTIGKIKSPFIEQQLKSLENTKLSSHSLASVAKSMKLDYRSTPHSARAILETSPTNLPQVQKIFQAGGSEAQSSDEGANADSGKENREHVPEAGIVELRKKQARLASGHQKSSELATSCLVDVPRRAVSQNLSTGPGNSSGTSSGSSSNRSSCAVDERYARYFGVKPAVNGATGEDSRTPCDVRAKLYAATYTSSAMTSKDLQQATHQIKRMLSPDTSSPPRRDPAAKRPRPLSIQLSAVTCKSLVLAEMTPPPVPPNSARTPRSNPVRPRPITLTEGMAITLTKPAVNKFEDIVVTKDELLTAAKEFNRLFCELF